MRVPIKLRRHSFLMLIKATILSQTSTCQLITHQHSETMRISHMDLQHSKDKDLCRIINSSNDNMVSKDSSSRTARGLKIRGKKGPSLLKNRC